MARAAERHYGESMSKAFTKDDAAPETIRRPATRAPPGEKRPITAAGRAAFEARLRALLEERPTLWAPDAPAVSVARRDALDAEIAHVQAILASTEVPPAPTTTDRAALGDLVHLEDEAGAALAYRLVGPDEADARTGKLSIASPLGRALLGKHAGDEVEIARPRGPARFTVLRAERDG